MKKMFLVEINYNELEENKDAHVLYDLGLEVTIENMMESYLEHNSIKKGYAVVVREINEIK